MGLGVLDLLLMLFFLSVTEQTVKETSPFGSQVKTKTKQPKTLLRVKPLYQKWVPLWLVLIHSNRNFSCQRREGVSFCQGWLFGAFMGTKCMLRKYVRASHKINKVSLHLFILNCPNAVVHMTLSGCTQNDCCVTLQI